MKLEDLQPYVLPSDIPETYQPIVSMIGVDALIKLCQYSMGNEIYFPMAETILRKTRNRMMIQEYTGYNIKDLSKKYGLTIKQVQNIIKSPARDLDIPDANKMG